MHVHTSICISVCLLALPLISLTCFATVPGDASTNNLFGDGNDTTSPRDDNWYHPGSLYDDKLNDNNDNNNINININNDINNDNSLRYPLQYSETNGPYVTYDGSLAACQRVNQASHLWYPTGQAQRDAVIAMYQGDYYNGVREDPPGVC
ncbi:hypothetical protein WR25_19104 [Diploscapter pachys]|uniref:SCP domain-containing protein n=1 Tax=Diploscapter pachys TaxID=2018661 RepID=A0A2A2LNE2_9BILA|nr:hypothetical protein WR25_19104 [Diploscapter pachys]